MSASMQARGPYGPRGFESLSRRQMTPYPSREVGKRREAEHEASSNHTACSSNHPTLVSDSSKSSAFAKHESISVHHPRQASNLSRFRTFAESTILPLGKGSRCQQDKLYGDKLRADIWRPHSSWYNISSDGKCYFGHISTQPLYVINNRYRTGDCPLWCLGLRGTRIPTNAISSHPGRRYFPGHELRFDDSRPRRQYRARYANFDDRRRFQ